MNLDLLLYHNNGPSLILAEDIPEIAAAWGVQCQIQIVPESALDDFTLPPPNAVLYVHGNAQQKYPAINPLRTLAAQRRDVKIILGIDDVLQQEKHFRNRDDYTYVRALLEQGFNAQHQVVAAIGTYIEFFMSRNPLHPSLPIEATFEKYVQQLKTLRGAEP